MKAGRAVGKARVTETKIEGASERVGGNQEEGDHSEGKEDRKIIRDGYAFAHERERESENEGRGSRRP